jgi:hypothetical protein
MGTKHRTKQDRRASRHKRQRSGGWSVASVYEGPVAGPNVVSASLEEVLAAMETVPAGLEWNEVADQVLPLFQRVRPYPAGMPEQVRVVVPPGLTIGLGVDIGPAFLNVSPEMLESWGQSRDAVVAQALRNLEARMDAVTADDVHDGAIADVPIRALQSPTGSASTYVLRPAALGRIFGTHRQLLIAPMRNLLISMPVGADRILAAWIFEEFAAEDPNCLAPAGFVVGDGVLEVEPLGDPFGSA